MNVFTKLWNDPVWSKLIAVAIGGIITALGTALRQRLTRLSSITLTVTHRAAALDTRPGVGYPLKYYIEMRNDSSKCVEVAVIKFDPKNMTVKSFPTEVMQVRFHTKWLPDPSAERVAVLPGQLCRAWIGIDSGKFNEEQVTAAAGSIGTLIVSANKKQFPIEL